jgi:hypothetical protein
MTNRFFYACQGIFISSAKKSLTDEFLYGVQSVSIDNDFQLFPLKDIGRSQETPLYLGPANQITIERLWSNLSNIITDHDSAPATYAAGHLLNPANLGHSIVNQPATDIREYDIKLVYAPDTATTISGEALDIVTYYRSLLTGINYEFSTQGPFKETLTFVNKIMNKEADNTIPSATLPLFLAGTRESNYEIFTRKNFDKTNSDLPSEVSDMASLGQYKDGSEVLGITNITVDVNIDYVRKIDTGRWRGADTQSQVNLWATVSLPIDVSCSFTITARRSFQQSILNSDKNFTDQRIMLVVASINTTDRTPSYYVVDLGNKNRLTSISVKGGDTGGNLAEYTLTYKNYNNDFSTYFRSDTSFTNTEQTTEKY